MTLEISARGDVFLDEYSRDYMIAKYLSETAGAGVFYALTGREAAALDCLTKACASPKSFGHAHHSYYQFACILALLGRREAAFEWLERSVSSGFACWPFFLKDPYLKNLRNLEGFEDLVSSLQAKYPDHLGLL